MAIICSNEHGWVLDHERAINLGCLSGSTSGTNASVTYRCCRDLFAIHHPFMMDTQFEKLVKLSSLPKDSVAGTSVSEDVGKTAASIAPQKKRKRKLPFNEGEEKFLDLHSKVRDLIKTAYTQLLQLARSKNWLSETHPLTDNNLKARTASKITGPGDSLSELSGTAARLGQQDHHPFDLGEHAGGPTDLFDTVITNSGDVTGRKFLGASYILPAQSSFLMSDISQVDRLLCDGLKYNLIVLDPPWQNKAVKRKRGYSMMSNVDLLELPITELAAPDALVVVWVTNRVQHLEYVTETLFPSWNIRLIGQWYWLKVTSGGEPVYDLESAHKKPYESLIIGRVNPRASDKTHCRNSCADFDVDNDSKDCHERMIALNEAIPSNINSGIQHKNAGDGSDDYGPSKIPLKQEKSEYLTGSTISTRSQDNMSSRHHCGGSSSAVHMEKSADDSTSPKIIELVPAQRVIISIPCSIHSRKPPLNEIFEKYVGGDGRCLEMFARNLIPGWTSWGNEVIKFQHIDYFEV